MEPPHWLAEVAAVAARLAPDRVPEVVALMHAMEYYRNARRAGRVLLLQDFAVA